ncbi:SURF1 family protein [Rheinheimera sp.]|uniref:SURF1 family protein n=1 Tax=Rheinheimera sp. TaxID=1869214 RepID=UPI00307D9F3E
MAASSLTPQWRPAQWLLVFITLAAFLLLCKLALWQWHRADEKQQLLQQQASWQQQGAMAWTQLPQADAQQLDGILIQGKAVWQKPALWLLDNQVLSGRAGYDVVIPVLVDQRPPLLLVNLGWVEAPPGRDELPQVQIPVQFELQGLLRTQLGGVLLGQNLEDTGLWPQRMQQVVPAELSKVLGQPLYSGLVYQQHSPFRYHYQSVVMPPEKHRAYAVQWALLALVVLCVAGALWRREF